MHVVVTNLSTLAVPFSSDQGKGFATLLNPGVPHTLDSADVTVANVGDNPDFVEELKDSVSGLLESLGKLLTFWKDHASTSGEDAGPEVHVSLENRGINGLRVLLGSNVNELTVQPGTTHELTSVGYIEIRELGV